MTVTLDRDEARRIAVRAQLLSADRPASLVPLVETLTFLQLDPTAVIAPSADLIAYSRLGAAYRPEQLVAALESERVLYEVKAMDDPITAPFAMVRPVSDLGLHLDRMSRWPEGMPRAAAWLQANDGFRRDVLALLRDNGPTLSKDIPDTAALPWSSTGWTHNQNVTRLLELLQGRGEVAVAGRVGRQRTWDLGERVYPSGIAIVPEAEAGALRDERRLRALGIARRACRVLTHAPVHGADCLLVVLGDLADLHRRSRPLGREPARLDDQDPDAEGRRLDAQHPAEAVDGELRGLVRRDARRTADAAPDRRELHDEPAALLAQQRDRRLGDVVDAPEVRLELGAEIGVVRRLDGRHVGVAGVVDDHVDPAEAVAGGGQRLPCLGGIGHVEAEREEAVAVALDELVELLRPGRRRGDAVAGLEGGVGEGAAEAARGACDEPCLFHVGNETLFH